MLIGLTAPFDQGDLGALQVSHIQRCQGPHPHLAILRLSVSHRLGHGDLPLLDGVRPVLIS